MTSHDGVKVGGPAPRTTKNEQKLFLHGTPAEIAGGILATENFSPTACGSRFDATDPHFPDDQPPTRSGSVAAPAAYQ